MNSNTFHTTFNLWSSKSFTLVFNIFWNFISYNVRNSKVMSLLHHASLQLNQPLNLLTVRVKIFQVALLYLLAKKSSCALICSSVKNFFINETKENDLQLFCIIPPHEFCPCYGSCREVDKFFFHCTKKTTHWHLKRCKLLSSNDIWKFPISQKLSGLFLNHNFLLHQHQ